MLNTLIMYVLFYFLVDFRRTPEEMGYFILMLYLSNWVIQSIGQLFAFVTPNEESANGLGGLSVILSVILMGFLITVSAMPDGWVWACKYACMNIFVGHKIMLKFSHLFLLFGHHRDVRLGKSLPLHFARPSHK